MEKCTSCNVKRKPVAAESLTNRFEIVYHKCPYCKTTLRLVERKPNDRNVGKGQPEAK